MPKFSGVEFIQKLKDEIYQFFSHPLGAGQAEKYQNIAAITTPPDSYRDCGHPSLKRRGAFDLFDLGIAG